MFWYTRLKISLSCSSNSNCRRLFRLQRLSNFLSRSGSRSETLKFSCTLQVDSGRHSRSPSWWSQRVATFHPCPDKEDIGEMFSIFCFMFEGIPWPPWDLRCPPHNCPARPTWCPRTRRSSGSTRFDQNSWTYYISLMFSSMWTFVYYLYIRMHLLFDMIGSWTSRRTGDICPYSDNLPHPVTVPTWKEV